jgi:rhodanese-related sulfurtransferase
MAAYVAQNKMSGYSPSIAVSELSDFVATHAPIILDVRDVFAFNRAHIQNAVHVPYTHASAYIPKLPTDKAILLYDETGKYAHLVLREFLQQGLKNVHIISGGFSSLVRYARVMHLTHLELPLPPLDSKSLQEHSTPDAPAAALQEQATQAAQAAEPIHPNQKLIVDVRTPQEFAMGAVPQAINIPLDILQNELEALQPYDREIILYCASGARSAYGVRVLQHFGFTNVTNGGGIMDMMQ